MRVTGTQIFRARFVGGLAALAVLASELPSAAAVVTTLAGSGRAGVADGPALEAAFMQPYGVAIGRNGNILVADASGQRIRVIDARGNVSTLAGGGEPYPGGLKVPPGYADGPLQKARFNFPTGIAVGPRGEIYVADSENHCIRLVEGGNVSTYAGSPAMVGSRNGSRQEAQFGGPRGIAADSRGKIYVADPDSGLRMISSDGTVSTVGTFVHPFGVAVGSKDDRVIFVSDDSGISRILQNGEIQTFRRPDYAGGISVQMGRELGFPFGVAALDDRTAFFTDIRTNSVRSLNFEWPNLRILGGNREGDAENSGGGHRDGDSLMAQFDAPTGIAVRPDGSLVVADGGSKRIRLISNVAEREPLFSIQGLPGAEAFPSDAYTIAVLGNSIVWYNTDWGESVPGHLEADLRKVAGCPRNVHVTPVLSFDSTLEAQVEYADLLASTYRPKIIVFMLDTTSIKPDNGGEAITRENASSWEGRVRDILRGAQKQLAADGVKLVAVAVPFAREVAPSEDVAEYPGGYVNLDARELLEAPLRASGVPLIDTWSAIEAEEQSPQHEPLFGTDDGHPSARGRALVASVVARDLARSEVCAPASHSAPQ